LAVWINEADKRDRGFTNLRGQGCKVIKELFSFSIKYVVAEQFGKTFIFILRGGAAGFINPVKGLKLRLLNKKGDLVVGLTKSPLNHYSLRKAVRWSYWN